MVEIPVTGKRVRGPGGALHQFRGAGTLRVGDDGATLEATYDPPGTGWIALGVTILTAIVVTAIAQKTGSAAGPGWIIWWLIIRAMRQKKVTLTLDASNVTDVIVDGRGLVGFRTTPEIDGSKLKDGWLGLKLKNKDDAALGAIRSAFGERARDAKVHSADRTSMIILAILVVVLIGLIIHISTLK